MVNGHGPVERATRAHVRRLCAEAPFTPAADAYAASAVYLAGRLDVEEVGTRAAGVSKALLGAMEALTREVGVTDDPWAAELAGLSTPILDAPTA